MYIRHKIKSMSYHAGNQFNTNRTIILDRNIDPSRPYASVLLIVDRPNGFDRPAHFFISRQAAEELLTALDLLLSGNEE